jgi:heat shock protein HtpX
VEAKAESVRSLEAGLEQAKRYARGLDLKFAYVTNGHEIIEYDFFTNGSRRLDRFPSHQELLQRWLLNSGMFEGSSNRLKTLALLVLLTVLLSGLGGLVAGPTGLTVALVVALLMNGLAYGFSDRIVLALHGAEPLSEDEAPEVHRIVRDLTRRLGIPMPRLYRVPTETPNAFATGRDPDHAAVAVTDGILRLLSPEELEGVLAHELLHVVNGDTLITTVTAVIAGAVMYLARMVRWAFLLMGGLLIRLGVSRTREYMADELGARLVGRSDGLIGALRKIEDFQRRVPADVPSPATAHLIFLSPARTGWSSG